MLITFAIPCYNSADYMDRCIQSVLHACEPAHDIEIVLIDDGSERDRTPQKADKWSAQMPDVIRTVHQENGGHGSAVLTGLAEATGQYFKVIDSDDWIDRDAMQCLLSDMRAHERQKQQIDLYITNYVYEHIEDDSSNEVGYNSILPIHKIFEWNDITHFHLDQNLLMHALMYRTEILRNGYLPLPKHTFYVDNIFAYVPLPRCRKLFYCNTPLYHYYIGRQDQSVNEQVMITRYEQQLRITRIMIDAYHLFDDVLSLPLRRYMMRYLTLMMAISSVFAHLSDDPASDMKLQELWEHLKIFDEKMYRTARHHILGVLSNLPSKVGRALSYKIYRFAQSRVKFN